ncbi:hypothetical protein C8R43DRAFT_571516 [Mycena crocata]|nr:hypothetical protein C8R43DRAFT_571516 [Mycena crocata]
MARAKSSANNIYTYPSAMKPAKFKTATCVLCRKRKLRCDGGDPCGPCSRTRTPVTCTYVPKTVGQQRSELPKGGACITCRQRKRRCDGNLPCKTCTQSSRPDECQYREKGPGKQRLSKQPHRADYLQSDSASTASSSSSRPATPPHFMFPDSAALNLPDEYIDTEFFPRPELNTMCYGADSTGSCDTLPILPPFLDSVSFPPSTLDSLPLDSSIELFEVRNLFLEHGWQYGLSVTTEKRQALSIGSADSTLVNVCELLGYLLKSHSHPDIWVSFDGQTEPETKLDSLIRDKLEGVAGPPPDPLLCLQAYTLLCLYSAHKEDISGAQEYVLKASNIVVHHAATLGLEDAPALEWCPMFDASYLSPHSVAEEIRAVFSQLIYLDACGTLFFHLDSNIDPGLLEKFRRLAVVHRSDTEINFIRAKSILFLNDSRELVAAWNRWNFGDPPPTAWTKQYWSLIEDIHTHLIFVNTALIDVSCIPELQGAQPTLKICILMSLAALAELYGLFARSQADSRQKHREVVEKIIDITKGFSDGDYPFLDATLSICWYIASRRLYDDHDPGIINMYESTIFLHECNRKLLQAGPFAIHL